MSKLPEKSPTPSSPQDTEGQKPLKIPNPNHTTAPLSCKKKLADLRNHIHYGTLAIPNSIQEQPLFKKRENCILSSKNSYTNICIFSMILYLCVKYLSNFAPCIVVVVPLEEIRAAAGALGVQF